MGIIGVTPTPEPPKPLQDIIFNIIIQNSLLIFIIISAIIIAILIGYIIKIIHSKSRKQNLIGFKDFNLAYYMVIFYRKIANIYHEIDRQKLEIKDSKLRYNNKDFSLIDRNKIAFADKENKCYAFDFDSGEQLTFNEPKSDSTLKEIKDLIDTWINKNVIKQLTAGLENSTGSRSLIIAIFVSLIIGLIAGVLVGYFGHTPPPTETPKAFINAVLGELNYVVS